MKSFGVLLVVSLVLALAQPAPAQDDGATMVLRLEGKEGPDCPLAGGKAFCYIPIEGDPDTAFAAGSTVQVELTAAGDAPHAIAVIDAAEQNEAHLLTGVLATPIAESDTVDAGGTTILEFTVPESGTLYFFCTVPDHEPVGMWFESDVQPTLDVLDGDGNNTADGNETGTPDDNTTAPMDDAAGGNNTTDAPDDDDKDVKEEDTPGVGFVAILGALVAVAVLVRRRAS